MSLVVRITYGWAEFVRYGDKRGSCDWLEREPRRDTIDIPFAGGELDDYLRRFNDRDPTLFGRDGDWPSARLSHYSSGTIHVALDAHFLLDGQLLDVPSAVDLRITPRDRQVAELLRDTELEAA